MTYRKFDKQCPLCGVWFRQEAAYWEHKIEEWRDMTPKKPKKRPPLVEEKKGAP